MTDWALQLPEGGYVDVRGSGEGKTAQGSATLALYAKPSGCGMQAVITQAWQYTYHEVPAQLRQAVPRAAQALGSAMGVAPKDKALASAVNVLRYSTSYLRGVDHEAQAELKANYTINEAVHAVNARDALAFEHLVELAEKGAYGDPEEEPPPLRDPIFHGRGIMIDDKGYYVAFSRDGMGLMRGVRLGKCKKDQWVHLGLVQRRDRLLGYLDGRIDC